MCGDATPPGQRAAGRYRKMLNIDGALTWLEILDTAGEEPYNVLRATSAGRSAVGCHGSDARRSWWLRLK